MGHWLTTLMPRPLYQWAASIVEKWVGGWVSAVRWKAGAARGRRRCWWATTSPPPAAGMWWATCPPAWQAVRITWWATILPNVASHSLSPLTLGLWYWSCLRLWSQIWVQVFNFTRFLRRTPAPPGHCEVFHHFRGTLCQEDQRDLWRFISEVKSNCGSHVCPSPFVCERCENTICKAHLNSCNYILGTPAGNHQLKVLLHLLLRSLDWHWSIGHTTLV